MKILLTSWQRSAGVAMLALLACSEAASAKPVGERLADARQAAREDRNAESARLFHAYLERNPEAPPSVRREYADQLIYSGRPEAAVPVLIEILAAPLDPGERLTARQSLALAYAWSDQQRRAIAVYEDILAEDPANEAAIHGRARSLHWLGLHLPAAEALRSIPAQSSVTQEVAQLRSEIERSRKPLTQISGSVANHERRVGEERFDIEVEGFRVEHSFYRGATEVSSFFERINYRAEGGESVSQTRPGVALRSRFSEWGEVGATLAVERQQLDFGSRDLLLGEVAFAAFPSDQLRFDVVAARRSFDDVGPIKSGITSARYFASADYLPTPMWRLTGRVEFATISDGNERLWGQAEVERRLSRSPNIFIGARTTAFRFSRVLDNGYFNPKNFRSAELTARGWSQIATRTWLDLSTAVGLEDVQPGATKFAYYGRANLSHGLSDRLELSLTAEAFSTRVRTAGDYSRRSLLTTLGWRW